MIQNQTILSGLTLQVMCFPLKFFERIALVFLEEFTKDKKKFCKKAEEFTLKNSAKRPSD